MGGGAALIRIHLWGAFHLREGLTEMRFGILYLPTVALHVNTPR